jgi:SAM-dependent methyltransferase
MRSLLVDAPSNPAAFRAALTSVSPGVRDAWLDLVLGLDMIPDDDPALPRGCVPYVPCSVDTVLQIAEHAGVQASDVFVDVGSGVGRAAALMHLTTGAAAIGLEIQPALVLASRDLAKRLSTLRLSVVEGDAALTAGLMVIGSVFFLYCPFSGNRLEKVLSDLESIARTRQIQVCTLDLPLPPCTWLALTARPSEGLSIYRSTLLDKPHDIDNRAKQS